MFYSNYKSLLIALFSFSFLSSYSQINVSGEAYGTWNKDNAPYYVIGDLTVPDDSTLVIEPGVDVIFDGDYEFIVEGTLKAVGEIGDSIIIGAYDIDTWGGIIFNNSYSGADGEMDDNDSSVFKYCIIYGVDKNHDMGGAIYLRSYSNVLISCCRITNNATSNGTIACREGSDPEIRNCLIADNQATGIWCDASSPMIIGNQITNNGSLEFPSMGGGISLARSNAFIFNNIITNNKTAWGGSGISCSNSSNARILNNTICYNESGVSWPYGSGTGIACSGASSPEIKNCIIWGNRSAEYYDQVRSSFEDCFPVISNCNIQGGLDSLWGEDLDGEFVFFGGQYIQNINQPPIFEETDSVRFTLSAISPCIDMGSPDTTELNLPSTDFFGNPRISNSRIDIGAIEFQGQADNRRPRIKRIPETNILKNMSVNMSVVFADVDSLDTYAITVTSSEDKVQVSNLSGHTNNSTYDLIPVDDWVGTAEIKVKVTDNSNQSNASDSIIYSLNVREDLCGVIRGQNYWDADTINVECDLVVEKGASLSIGPGTVVLFSNGSKMEVYGKVIAIGKVGDSIVFATNDTIGYSANYTHTGWGGIKMFNNVCDTSIFSHCIFRYGKIRHRNGNSEYEIDENSGGALYISNYINVIIEFSEFKYNYAYYAGSAIYINKSNCIARSNLIMRNKSYRGGAIYSNLSKSEIINNIVAYNVGGNAGGIYCNDSAFISGNIISNNRITDTGAKGGGMFCAGNPIIVNNIICNNSEKDSGGSSSGGGIYFKYCTPLLFSNNLIYGNRADRGGAIAHFQSNITIQNTIIWKNSSEYDGPIYGSVKLENCVYDYPTEPNNSNIINVYRINPALRSPSEGIGIQFDGLNADWSLTDSSICINNGIEDMDISFFPYDIVGNSRIVFDTIDIGPFESEVWSYNDSATNNVAVMHQSSLDLDIQIFPNPSTGSFTIEFEDEIPEKAIVTVLNTDGILIFQERLTKNIMEIDLRDSSPGVYLVKVDLDNTVIQRRIVIHQ